MPPIHRHFQNKKIIWLFSLMALPLGVYGCAQGKAPCATPFQLMSGGLTGSETSLLYGGFITYSAEDTEDQRSFSCQAIFRGDGANSYAENSLRVMIYTSRSCLLRHIPESENKEITLSLSVFLSQGETPATEDSHKAGYLTLGVQSPQFTQWREAFFSTSKTPEEVSNTVKALNEHWIVLQSKAISGANQNTNELSWSDQFTSQACHPLGPSGEPKSPELETISDALATATPTKLERGLACFSSQDLIALSGDIEARPEEMAALSRAQSISTASTASSQAKAKWEAWEAYLKDKWQRDLEQLKKALELHPASEITPTSLSFISEYIEGRQPWQDLAITANNEGSEEWSLSSQLNVFTNKYPQPNQQNPQPNQQSLLAVGSWETALEVKLSLKTPQGAMIGALPTRSLPPPGTRRDITNGHYVTYAGSILFSGTTPLATLYVVNNTKPAPYDPTASETASENVHFVTIPTTGPTTGDELTSELAPDEAKLRPGTTQAAPKLQSDPDLDPVPPSTSPVVPTAPPAQRCNERSNHECATFNICNSRCPLPSDQPAPSTPITITGGDVTIDTTSTTQRVTAPPAWGPPPRSADGNNSNIHTELTPAAGCEPTPPSE